MKKTLYLFITFILFVSCGAKSDKLQFSEFEVKDENGITRVVVDDTGNIVISGDEIGKINRDGTLNDLEGNLIAKITESNVLQDKDGEELVNINNDGRMDNGSGVFIEWSADGELMKGNELSGMQLAPVDKKSFQTASIVLFMYLSIQ